MDDSDSKLDKYVLFFFLGIFTFFLSGYVLSGVHAPMSIFLMGLIYLALLALGIVLSRERSAGFALKAFAVSFVALFLISAGFFALSAYSHSSAKWIEADKLDFEPDEYAVVTEEELNEYPALREAIEASGSSVKVGPGEWTRTYEFLNEKGFYEIKVGGDYYGISFMTA
jgi:ABC-type multidrug transport system permease subunit